MRITEVNLWLRIEEGRAVVVDDEWIWRDRCDEYNCRVAVVGVGNRASLWVWDPMGIWVASNRCEWMHGVMEEEEEEEEVD